MEVQGSRELETPQNLSKRLGVEFSNIFLLTRSLTHRSYLNEHADALEDNERLEFLGDAVLDFLVGAWLYNRFPEMAEGELTRLRSALVRTEQLAVFSNKLGLGNAMRLGRGEAESGGRQRMALLCATFEAFIGAYYLDAGIEAVCKFLKPMLEEVTTQLLITGKTRDPKSTLQEYVQAKGNGAPKYRTITATGPDHAKVFEVEVLINGQRYGHGIGKSKQAAAKAAAMEAIALLGID